MRDDAKSDTPARVRCVVQKYGLPGWDRVESATKSGLGFGAVVGAIRGTWDVRSQTCLPAWAPTPPGGGGAVRPRSSSMSAPEHVPSRLHLARPLDAREELDV